MSGQRAPDGTGIVRHVAEAGTFARELMESVNHHLRTPLTVVLCHAELLVEQGHDLPAEVDASHAAVLRAARRLDEVVLGVCDLLAALVEPRSPAPTEVTALVAEEVSAHRSRATVRRVSIVSADEGPQACVTDAHRLRRALRELLANALAHAPEGSAVRVSTARSADGVRIEVCDEGGGTGPGGRDRAASPFERGDHPVQSSSGGLGLALVSVVAASLGGRLLLSDDGGAGLRARLELPLDLTAVEQPGR